MTVPVSLEIYQRFDLFLQSRELTFEGLIVGGAAFMLLGARDAATEDVDFINQIPGPIRHASEEFAKQEGLNKVLKLRCPSPDNLLISKLCRIADSGPRLQDIEDVRPEAT